MSTPSFRPDRILGILVEHGVEFVLIGGSAAVVHGSPHLTQDVDVCPRLVRENLERLVTALVELDARVRTQGVDEPLPFERSAEFLCPPCGRFSSARSGAEVWGCGRPALRLSLALGTREC